MKIERLIQAINSVLVVIMSLSITTKTESQTPLKINYSINKNSYLNFTEDYTSKLYNIEYKNGNFIFKKNKLETLYQLDFNKTLFQIKNNNDFIISGNNFSFEQVSRNSNSTQIINFNNTFNLTNNKESISFSLNNKKSSFEFNKNKVDNSIQYVMKYRIFSLTDALFEVNNTKNNSKSRFRLDTKINKDILFLTDIIMGNTIAENHTKIQVDKSIDKNKIEYISEINNSYQNKSELSKIHFTTDTHMENIFSIKKQEEVKNNTVSNLSDVDIKYKPTKNSVFTYQDFEQNINSITNKKEKIDYIINLKDIKINTNYHKNNDRDTYALNTITKDSKITIQLGEDHTVYELFEKNIKNNKIAIEHKADSDGIIYQFISKNINLYTNLIDKKNNDMDKKINITYNINKSNSIQMQWNTINNKPLNNAIENDSKSISFLTKSFNIEYKENVVFNSQNKQVGINFKYPHFFLNILHLENKFNMQIYCSQKIIFDYSYKDLHIDANVSIGKNSPIPCENSVFNLSWKKSF